MRVYPGPEGFRVNSRYPRPFSGRLYRAFSSARGLMAIHATAPMTNATGTQYQPPRLTQ